MLSWALVQAWRTGWAPGVMEPVFRWGRRKMNISGHFKVTSVVPSLWRATDPTVPGDVRASEFGEKQPAKETPGGPAFRRRGHQVCRA